MQRTKITEDLMSNKAIADCLQPPAKDPQEPFNFWCKPCGGVVYGRPADHAHTEPPAIQRGGEPC